MISFLDSLSNLSRGLTHLNISDTRLSGKGLNKIFEILMQHESIFSGLQVLNISDNPTKGEDLQVNENIWSIIVPKERTYCRQPSIIRSGT